jgi:hypothetical protein
MTSTFSNIFSDEDIKYLTQHPDTLSAKAKISISSSSDVVYFKISLTESIRNTLFSIFGLDLSNISEIPMRWIKGDISPHKDGGSSKFEHTYLIYLNDSPGEFIVDSNSFLIKENTGFVFKEGTTHLTNNTGNVPRLLLGPMNEFIEPVGVLILYYTNYADALAMNGNSIASQAVSFVLGDSTYIVGNIGSYTLWRIATVVNQTTPLPTGVYSNGTDLNILYPNGYTYYVYPATPCFLEGTKILCQLDGIDKYIPIEQLTPGTLVKTCHSGYKKVEVIRKGSIFNPGNDERIEDRLYKCSVKNYPELTEDLYITGCHSILVDKITDIQRENIIKHLGRVFITEKKYRLTAYVDERAEPWNSEGSHTIWHVALENKDPKMNYGIYANGGLLVETCSINFLKNKSNMMNNL